MSLQDSWIAATALRHEMPLVSNGKHFEHMATNEGVQPKQTEVWRRLKSPTPREFDVLC